MKQTYLVLAIFFIGSIVMTLIQNLFHIEFPSMFAQIIYTVAIGLWAMVILWAVNLK